jgi:hypothetical protein
MELVQDNFILLSVVNTYLRDSGGDLLWLCDEKDWNADEIKERLATIGYSYDENQNAFTPLSGRQL